MKYLEELKRHLRELPQSEQNNIINYYQEYIEDAGFNENELVTKLGSPKSLAQKLKFDYFMDNDPHDDRQSEPVKHKDVRVLWIVILGILSLPISIPILITLVFVPLIILVTLIFTVIVVSISLIFASLVTIVSGLAIINQSLWGGLFYVGIGLAIGGLMAVILSFMPTVIKLISSLSLKIAKYLQTKFKKEGSSK
ncbi:DUF1700 domain-containing protein [Convivina praedatoris]|uniref:DUF1700 domain-containing protein n=1 Tax=Convivina praedatoris TaxID=2880963 RepID=A0ABN8HCZ1_9LACO|nr:DUF1700 domain-containing protein [Convivina sp. LMG 32447]CAH1851775.1 hypothetical protein R077815_00398 [Convivina sp. LMG 32447]CAH1853859.1 hypothetical protein LMG032447_00730 [Convivina sp. LMG 32447]CAH1854225.1 hypothetical protein R078138_00832 [Convivina sp. LMG 32447]